MSEQIGKMLVGVGLVIVVIGGILILSARISWLKLGRLPGDVNIQRNGFSLYAPFTTMLLLSAVLSLILFLVGRMRR